MESLVKADIFFFITSIAVVVISLLLTVILVLIIRILQDIRDIAALAKSEAEGLRDDFSHMRSDMRAGMRATRAFVTAASVKQALGFLMNTLTETMAHKKRRRKRSGDD